MARLRVLCLSSTRAVLVAARGTAVVAAALPETPSNAGGSDMAVNAGQHRRSYVWYAPAYRCECGDPMCENGGKRRAV